MEARAMSGFGPALDLYVICDWAVSGLSAHWADHRSTQRYTSKRGEQTVVANCHQK
jgi:hypothetical protein